jgi:hypothetical protein
VGKLELQARGTESPVSLHLPSSTSYTRLQIAWKSALRQRTSQGVRVKLSDVRVVASPREAGDWEAPAAERRAQAAKQAAVAAAELDKLRLASGNGGGSLGDWLVGPLVEALHLELAGVHVRFQELLPVTSEAAPPPGDGAMADDDSKLGGRRLAALGVCLSKLVLRAATAEDGDASADVVHPGGGAADAGMTHKVVLVSGLSAYVDPGSSAAAAEPQSGDGDDAAPELGSCHNILEPLDATVHVQLSKRGGGGAQLEAGGLHDDDPTSSEPQSPPAAVGNALHIHAAQCSAPTVRVTDAQVGVLLRVADAVDVWSARNKFGVYRPASWRATGRDWCSVTFGATPRQAGTAAVTRGTGRPAGWANDGWHYACAAVATSLRAGRRWTSRQELLARRDTRLAYLAASAARLHADGIGASSSGGVLGESDPAAVVEAIEAGLSVSDILLLRTMAEQHVASSQGASSTLGAAAAGGGPRQSGGASASTLAAESSTGSLHSSSGGADDGGDGGAEDDDSMQPAAPPHVAPAQPGGAVTRAGGRRQQRRGWVRSGVAFVLGSLPLVDARRRFPSLLAPEEKEWRDELLRALEATAESGGDVAAPASSTAVHASFSLSGLTLQLVYGAALASRVKAAFGAMALRADSGASTAVQLRVASLHVTLEGDDDGALGDSPAFSTSACTLCAAHGTLDTPMLLLDVDVATAVPTVRGALRGLTLAHAPHHGPALAACGDAVVRYLPLEGASLLAHRVAAACSLATPQARDAAREQIVASMGGPWCVQAFAVDDVTLLLGSAAVLDAAFGVMPGTPALGAASARDVEVSAPLSPVREADDAESLDSPGTPPARNESCEDGESSDTGGGPPGTPRRHTDAHSAAPAASPCCMVVHISSASVSTPPPVAGSDVDQRSGAAPRADPPQSQAGYTRLNIAVSDITVSVQCPTQQDAEAQTAAVSVRLAELPSLHASLALLRLPRDDECISVRAAVKTGVLAAQVSPASARLVRSVLQCFDVAAPQKLGDQQPVHPLYVDVSLTVAAVSLDLLPATRDGYWQNWRLDGLALSAANTAANGAVVSATVVRCRADGAPADGRAPAAQLARFLPSIAGDAATTTLHFDLPHVAASPLRTPSLLTARYTAPPLAQKSDAKAPVCAAMCHVDGLDAAISWGALTSVAAVADAYAVSWPAAGHGAPGLPAQCHALAVEAQNACERHRASRGAHLSSSGSGLGGDDGAVMPAHRTVSDSTAASVARRAHHRRQRSGAAHDAHSPGDTSSSGMSDTLSEEGDEEDGTDVWEDAVSAWGTESELSDADRHVHSHGGSASGRARHGQPQAATAAAAARHDAEAHDRHAQWLRLGFTAAAAAANTAFYTPDDMAGDAGAGPLRVTASATSLRLRLLVDDLITGSVTLASARVAALRLRGDVDMQRGQLRCDVAMDISGVTLADESGWRPVPVLGGHSAATPLTVAVRTRSDEAGVAVTVAMRSARAVLAMSTVQSLVDWAHHGAAMFHSPARRDTTTAAKPLRLQMDCELHDALVVVPEGSASSGSEPRCALLAVPHVALASAQAKHRISVRGITLTAAPSERAPGHEAVLALPELTVDATSAGAEATTVTVALPRAVAVCLSPRRVGLLALLAHQMAERFPGHDADDDAALTPSRDTSRSATSMTARLSAAGLEVRLRGDLAAGGAPTARDLPHCRLALRGLAAHLDTAASGPGSGGRGHVTWEELTVTEDAMTPSIGAQRSSGVSGSLFHLGGASSTGNNSLAAPAGPPRVDVDWSASSAVSIRVSVSGACLDADVAAWERLVVAAAGCMHAASLAPPEPVTGGMNHGKATPAAKSGPDAASAPSSVGGLTPQRSVHSTSAAVLRQQFSSSAAALEVLMSPHSGGAAVAAAAAALGHGAVVSPMHDALATVRHAVPALNTAANGRADHETVSGLALGDGAQPASAKRLVASAFASAAAVPAAGQQALQRQSSRRQPVTSRGVAAAPMVVTLSVDAQAWQLVVPQGAHLRFGMFIDASATIAPFGDTRWSVEARCAPVVLSLLDLPPPQAPQLQSAAQSAGAHAGSVVPSAPVALRRVNASTASLSADGHWALPPSGSERSLSFASATSSMPELGASPRFGDNAAFTSSGGQAAASRMPLLQLDGLCLGAVSTPSSAPASGIHITARVTAVSAWVSPRRLHALRALQSASSSPLEAHGAQTRGGASTNGTLPLAVPLRITCEAASIAALLSDDRAGVTVPILEAALLDAAMDVSIRPLAAPFGPLDAAGQAASVATSASMLAAPPAWHVLDVTSRATSLIDYYNTDIAAWEPLLEPWRVTIRAGLAPGAVSLVGPPLPRGHLAVTSPGRVDVTLTHAGSDALAAANDALTAAAADGQQGVHGPAGAVAIAAEFASPFWLHNHTGVPLRYVLVAADAAQCAIPSASPQLETAFQAGQTTGAAGVVPPGGLAPLLVAGTSTGMGAGGRYVRAHASAGDHLSSSGGNGDAASTAAGASSPSTLASPHAPSPPAYKCVRFALEGSPWFSRGIALTALGARHFDARVGTTRARAVCDVARRAGGRGGRILHVRSDVSLRNSCATALEVAIHPRGAADMHGSDSGAITPLVTLAPGERTWLPLLSTDGGLPSLRCRPVAGPDADSSSAVQYAWSDAAPMRHLLDVARASVGPLGPGTKPGAVVVCPVSSAAARGGPFWVCVDCSPLVWAAAPQLQPARSSGASGASHADATHVPVGIELRLRPPLDVFNALPVPVELCIRGPGAGGSAGGEGDTLMAPLSRCCIHTLDPASVARLFFRPDGFARSNPVALPTAPELMQQAMAHGYSEQEDGGRDGEQQMAGLDEAQADDDVAHGPPAALAAALSPRLFEVIPTSTGAPPGGGVTLGVSAWPVGGAARAAVLRARLVVYNHTRLLLAAEPVATSPAAVPTVGPGDTPGFALTSSATLQHRGAHMYDARAGWRRGRGRVLPPAMQGELQASGVCMAGASGGGPAHPPVAGLRVLTSAGRQALESSSKLGLAVASAAGPPVWSSPANSMADLLALPAGAVSDVTPDAALLQGAIAGAPSTARGEGHVITATPVLLGSEADWLPGAPPLRLRLQAASSSAGAASTGGNGGQHAHAASPGTGPWSKTFGADPVDAATSSRTQTVLTPSGCGAYALVVTRAPSSAAPSPGEWPATSVVHIRPRCILRNGLSCALRVRVVPSSGAAPATQFGGTLHARALVLAPGAWCEVHPWEDPDAGHAATSSSLFWSPSHAGSSGGAGAFPGALVSLRYAEGGWDWSGALPLDTPGETLLRLRHRGRGASHVLRIDVRESRGAPGTWTAAVVASSAASSAGTAAGASFMPFRLENFTGVTLRFRQRVGPRGIGVLASSAAWAGGVLASGNTRRGGPVSSTSSLPDTDAVPPYNAAEFAWDEPTQPRRLVLEAPPDKGGLLGTFGLDTVGTVATLRAGGAELLVRVSADGPTRVLSVIDTALHPVKHMAESAAVAEDEVDDETTRQQSHHSHHHHGTSASSPASHALLPVVPFAGELLSIGVDIGGLALSLVGPTEELLYACISGVTLHAARSALDVTLHARAVRVQVDNQLRRTISPVMLSCGGLPVGPISSAAAAMLRRAESVRSGGDVNSAALPPGVPSAAIDIAVLAPSSAEALLPRRPGPAVALRFARWRRRANGVVCVREMVVEISPMTVDLDDQLVEALPAFIQALVEPHGSNFERNRPGQVDGSEHGAADLTSDDVAGSRSEETKVYIERLHISPLRIRLTARRLPFLPHGVKVLTCIEGAALTFAGLDLAHPLLPTRELGAHAARHYQRQGRAAVTTLVGSVSLLGDPVGLAAALRRAAWRLVHGAEPEDDDAGGMMTPASAAGLRHDPLTAARLGGTAAASTASSARRFASDLVVALTDALRKSSGAIRVVALRASVELEARVQRRAAQQQLQLASASRDGMARQHSLARQTTLNRTGSSGGASRPGSPTSNGAAGSSATSPGGLATPPQTPQQVSASSGSVGGASGSNNAAGRAGAAQHGPSGAFVPGALHQPDVDAVDAAADADVLTALAHGLAALLAAPFVGLERRGIVGALEGAALGMGAALARPAASAAALAVRVATATRDAAAHGVAAQPPPVSRVRPPRVVPPAPHPVPRYSAEHAAGAAILRAASGVSHGRHDSGGLPTPLGRLPVLPFRGAWTLVGYTSGAVGSASAAAPAHGGHHAPPAYLVLTPRHALVGSPPTSPGAHEWVVPWATPLPCVVTCTLVSPGVLRLLLVSPLHMRLDADAGAAHRWRRAMAALEGKEHRGDTTWGLPATLGSRGGDGGGEEMDDEEASSRGDGDALLLAPRHTYRVVPPPSPWSSLTLFFGDEDAAAAAAAAIEAASSRAQADGVVNVGGSLAQRLRLNTLHEM